MFNRFQPHKFATFYPWNFCHRLCPRVTTGAWLGASLNPIDIIISCFTGLSAMEDCIWGPWWWEAEASRAFWVRLIVVKIPDCARNLIIMEIFYPEIPKIFCSRTAQLQTGKNTTEKLQRNYKKKLQEKLQRNFTKKKYKKVQKLVHLSERLASLASYEVTLRDPLETHWTSHYFWYWGVYEGLQLGLHSAGKWLRLQLRLNCLQYFRDVIF